MAYTLAQIVERVRAEVRDASGRFIDDDDVKRWANQAQDDLAARQFVLSKTVADVTADTTIAQPADYLHVRSLRLGTDLDDDVLFVDDDTFFSWTDSGESPGFTMAREHAAEIELYPAPAVGTAYSLAYFYTPAALDADDDVSGIPRDLRDKVVLFCIARAQMKLREWSAADRFMQMYEKGLRPHPNGTDRNQPSLSVVPIQDGYFDSLEYLT